MSFSRTYQGTILTAIKVNTLQLALYTTDPTSSDMGTEVTAGAYARQTVAFSANTVNGLGTEITNSGVITFPTATADWSSGIAVTHFAIRTTPGDVLVTYGALTSLGVPTSRIVRSGDVFQLAIGVIKIRLPD